jgi:hypothetical protein
MHKIRLTRRVDSEADIELDDLPSPDVSTQGSRFTITFEADADYIEWEEIDDQIEVA